MEPSLDPSAEVVMEKVTDFFHDTCDNWMQYKDNFKQENLTSLDALKQLNTIGDLDKIVSNDVHREEIWKAIRKLKRRGKNPTNNKYQDKFQDLYGHVDLENVWDILTGKKDICTFKPKKNITIAIIDTGVQQDHEAFNQNGDSNVLKGKSFMGKKKNPWVDKNGHGTMCASIAAGKRLKVKIGEKTREEILGVAPFAKILPLQVSNDGDTTLTKVAKAIDWIIQKPDTEKVDIISISLGFEDCSKELQKAVNEATAKGIIVVACASNEGDEDQYNIKYPGRLGNVICVGANGGSGRATSFSSSGREVDFLAPGEDIYVANCKSKSSVERESGTSFATPFVAGVCALVLAFAEKCKALGPDLRKRISHTQIMKQILYQMTTSPGSHKKDIGYGNVLPWNFFKYGEEAFKTIDLDADGLSVIQSEVWKETGNKPQQRKAIDACEVQKEVKKPIIQALTCASFSDLFCTHLVKDSLCGDVMAKWRIYQTEQTSQKYQYEKKVKQGQICKPHAMIYGYEIEDEYCIQGIVQNKEITEQSIQREIAEITEESDKEKFEKAKKQYQEFKTALGNLKDSCGKVVEDIVKQITTKATVGKNIYSLDLTTPDCIKLRKDIVTIVTLFLLDALSEKLPSLESIERLILPYYIDPKKLGIQSGALHLLHITKEIFIPFKYTSMSDLIHLFGELENGSSQKYTVNLTKCDNKKHTSGQVEDLPEFKRTVLNFEGRLDDTCINFFKTCGLTVSKQDFKLSNREDEYKLLWSDPGNLYCRYFQSQNTGSTKPTVTVAIFGSGIESTLGWDIPNDIIGLCNTVPTDGENTFFGGASVKRNKVGTWFTSSLINQIRLETNQEDLRFVVVKVLDEHGYYCHDWVLQGIKWLKKNDKELHVDVILIPLQFKKFDPELYECIQMAINGNKNDNGQGKIVVASPLRSTNRTTRYQFLGYPAGYGNVLCAGACLAPGKVHSFSPSGREIDFTLIAPDEPAIDNQGSYIHPGGYSHLATAEVSPMPLFGLDLASAGGDSYLTTAENPPMPLEMASASLTSHVVNVLAFARSLAKANKKDKKLADALTNIAVMRYVLQQSCTQSGNHEDDIGHGTIYLLKLLNDPNGHRLKVLVNEISDDYIYH